MQLLEPDKELMFGNIKRLHGLLNEFPVYPILVKRYVNKRITVMNHLSEELFLLIRWFSFLFFL
jgi:hypothetical protein